MRSARFRERPQIYQGYSTDPMDTLRSSRGLHSEAVLCRGDPVVYAYLGFFWIVRTSEHNGSCRAADLYFCSLKRNFSDLGA